jgi:hypothetical protein
MNMKAISLASLLAIGLVGTACSDTPAQTEEVAIETPVATELAAPVDDGFNLRIPGTDADAPVANDGFNLSIPDSGSTIASGEFNLPSDIPVTDGLADIPEVDLGLLEDTVEETVETPDEDEIIRIE